MHSYLEACTLNGPQPEKKPVLVGVGTIKAQTSLRIHAVWSAPLLFAHWKVSDSKLL